MPDWDIYELIDSVMQDEKLKGSGNDGKVYRDEPILRPASQIPRPQNIKSAVPEKIQEMKRIAYSDEMIWKPREYIFYVQAKFMEDYEDDYKYYGRFDMLYPTYSAMNTEQLRGYFTWRTQLRKGGEVTPERSFIFLYIYEILNGIGTSNAGDGLKKLTEIRDKYAGDSTVRYYLNRWIRDHIIYNRLPAAELIEADKGYDSALSVLQGYADEDDNVLFPAIQRLSGYNFEASTFYKDYPEDFQTVACGVYRKLSEYNASHNKKTLFEKYFGKRVKCVYNMFSGAVFYDRNQGDSLDYEVNDMQRYEYRNGVWYSDMFQGDRTYSKQLYELIRAVDHLMRQKYDYRHKLGGCTATKIETKLIESETDSLIEHHKREEAARIDIDISKLGGIRQAAELTRDKLIVDEEEISETEDEIQAEPSDAGSGQPETPLDVAEYRFMQCLLYGGDHNAASKKAGTMPSLLADKINEKLFDLFDDTVIDFSGGEPELIEDYIDELKGMIHE